MRDERGGSPLARAEHGLHPWVAFGILPLFGFCNAGVNLAGASLAALAEPITLGIGAGLVVEARAPDGIIEAVRVADAPGFALAVQWHPEWQVMKNDFSRALFAAFGDAARARARGAAAATDAR